MLKVVFEYPAVMQQFLCKSWFLARKLSIPHILDHYVDWWHLTACQWTNLVPALLQLHLETIHSGKPWINMKSSQHFVFRKWIFKVSFSWKTRVSPLKCTFLECKNFPFFRASITMEAKPGISAFAGTVAPPMSSSCTINNSSWGAICWYILGVAPQQWPPELPHKPPFTTLAGRGPRPGYIYVLLLLKWDVQQKRLQDLRFWKREDTFSTWF